MSALETTIANSQAQPTLMRRICISASALTALALLAAAADAGPLGGGGGGGGARIGGGGGGFGGGRAISAAPRIGGGGFAVRSFSAPRIGGSSFAVRSYGGGRFVGRSFSSSSHVTAARFLNAGPGSRFTTASAHTLAAANLSRVNLARVHATLGNRAIVNQALIGQHVRPGLGLARFQGGFNGRFHGSHWPWWRGGIVIGWIGPVFWPYAYDDFFDYVFWPYVYDDFWPYAFDDVYYGIYGGFAYPAPVVGPVSGPPRRRGGASTRGGGVASRPSGVCSDETSKLTDWPVERIVEVVQPTDAQRALLDALKAANAKAVDILKGACPKDLASIPTGRLAAMQARLEVMLQAVQTIRPALDQLYQSLDDEQKARFNAIMPTNDASAGKDRRDLATFCDERTPGVTDLPIDRIAQVVQPTAEQEASLDELKDASLKAAEGLKAQCPSYQALTPTGRVEAMEQRLTAMLDAVKTVQPALAKFYDSLSDEQKARFNAMRSTAKPVG
jgi:hypothetical protein